jgi:hypothetical protein
LDSSFFRAFYSSFNVLYLKRKREFLKRKLCSDMSEKGSCRQNVHLEFLFFTDHIRDQAILARVRRNAVSFNFLAAAAENESMAAMIGHHSIVLVRKVQSDWHQSRRNAFTAKNALGRVKVRYGLGNA